MWLLSCEPPAWLVLSHDQGISHQVPPSIGSWVCNFFPAASSSQLLFSRQWSTSHYLPVSVFTYLISKQLHFQRVQPMVYVPPHLPYKGRKKSTAFIKPPPTFQHLRHVANPLSNLTLSISLPSFYHFYLVQTPKIVSYFYPVFNSLSLI